VELEHPIALLEPLLFLFSAALTELCALLRSQSRAARLLEVNLDLEAKPPYRAVLEFPVPVTDHRTMLKLLQLHLERHSPEAQITAFHLRIEPVAPRRVQSGLFLPATPLPDKLQITLARIAGMVGEENVGSPRRLNTHRPDAFRLASLNLQQSDALIDFPPRFRSPRTPRRTRPQRRVRPRRQRHRHAFRRPLENLWRMVGRHRLEPRRMGRRPRRRRPLPHLSGIPNARLVRTGNLRLSYCIKQHRRKQLPWWDQESAAHLAAVPQREKQYPLP